jgi:Domain of unknown function (DUF4166)/Saccharopine dehydrogenase NADP binding domain
VTDTLTVLIIGGYGTFGGRIVQLLENDPGLTLIVAGRFLRRAEDFCRSRGKTACRLIPAAYDRDRPEKLAALHPDLVIDASGPFQAYGDAPYRVVETCLAAGANYIDLADRSDFVAGIAAFDRAARAAGCFVLSGASSFPALLAAVVRRLSRDAGPIESISAGIAPSPHARVGPNVIRAIASYAGQRRTFTDHRRATIGPPGYAPLHSRLFSRVDAPDPGFDQPAWLGAAPAPALLHRLLIAGAWLVRWRILPNLSFLAPLMHAATSRLRWGEHRGGMFVEVTGHNFHRAWHLVAEGDSGPLIPSMAAAALVRCIQAGHPPEPGARTAARDVALEDYEAFFHEHGLHAGVWDRLASKAPLYRHLLGAAWDELPAEIAALHRAPIASGRASVDRGRGVLARMIATVVGFPPATDDTRVTVRFDEADGVETWTRTFGDRSFSSRQCAGTGRSAGLLCERFGPLTFAMALVLKSGRLSLMMRRGSAFGVPIPLWLCPAIEAYEHVEDGKFHFHVEIRHRLTGLIVRYRGWLGVS